MGLVWPPCFPSSTLPLEPSLSPWLMNLACARCRPALSCAYVGEGAGGWASGLLGSGCGSGRGDLVSLDCANVPSPLGRLLCDVQPPGELPSCPVGGLLLLPVPCPRLLPAPEQRSRAACRARWGQCSREAALAQALLELGQQARGAPWPWLVSGLQPCQRPACQDLARQGLTAPSKGRPCQLPVLELGLGGIGSSAWHVPALSCDTRVPSWVPASLACCVRAVAGAESGSRRGLADAA